MQDSAAIAAVIVTYHSGADVTRLFPAIMAQVGHLYIVDNGSDAVTVAALRSYGEAHATQVTLILNEENIGLAAAQNQGIRQVLTRGFDWVLLLDDDSELAADMVTQLLTAAEKSPNTGIVAPLMVEKNVAKPTGYLVPRFGVWFTRQHVHKGELLHEAVTAIASGSLIRADLLRAVGLMNEGFFIDYVDHEFCLRAYLHDYAIVISGDAVLVHELGRKTGHLGALTTSNHSALRRYYIFRNRCFVLRMYGLKLLFLIPHEMLACGWDMARVMAFEAGKGQKLCAMLRGLWHGMTWKLPVAPMA